jgi:hypothetical protein
MKNIISLVGMSGVGKTHYASLQNPSQCFHYSVDYIIGKYLLKNDILDDLSNEICNSDFVKDLIKQNKLLIDANINIKDLSLVSCFLGKFGSKEFGGLDKKEFLRRQKLYCEAEKEGTLYLEKIADKIFSIGYKYIMNDLTGSICEVIDLNNKNDKISNFLNKTTIKYFPASEEHKETLIERAKKEPKPLLFSADFFEKTVENFIKENGLKSENDIIPDEFCIYSFPKLIDYRIPKYEKVAKL